MAAYFIATTKNGYYCDNNDNDDDDDDDEHVEMVVNENQPQQRHGDIRDGKADDDEQHPLMMMQQMEVEVDRKQNRDDDDDDDNDDSSASKKKLTTATSSNNNNKATAGITNSEAGISLAKAIMGAGSFALPWAFAKMGYVFGPICLGVLMWLSVYSLNLLVKCTSYTHISNNNKSNHGGSSYVDVARSAFGNVGARMAYGASISASIGVCGSYLVFIAANLQSLLVPVLLQSHTATNTEAEEESGPAVVEDQKEQPISQSTIILIIVPFVVLLSSVRDVKRFAFVSLLGNVSVFLGMLVVVVYGLAYHSSTTALGSGCVAIASGETMSLAFGAIGYLFLVHFLSLPIHSAMARPDQFHVVSKITFAGCAITSGAFGVIGYLVFGQDTQQIVLLNVRGSFFVSAVKLLLCIDLLFTYPVVMRPSIVIVEQSWVAATRTALPSLSKVNREQRERGNGSGGLSTSRSSSPPAAASSAQTGVADLRTHMAACIILGSVAAVCSIFIPAFGLLSGLVGGVSQTFLAFVLPPLMLSKLQQQQQQQQRHLSFALVGKELALVFMGVALIIWTLASTWMELTKGEG